MIDADDFLTPAFEAGIKFWSGVPCSFLTPIINRVIGRSDIQYVGAASEGEAVAISAGAWLGGTKSAVMFQNSGLGNAVNPLTSLNEPFKIPALVLTTWRGQPGLGDEPQHELMGQITDKLLDTMAIRHAPFPSTIERISDDLALACAEMDDNARPFAFIMEKGSVCDPGLEADPPRVRAAGQAVDLCRHGGDVPSRFDAIECIADQVPTGAGLIATTGKCGRELFTLRDSESHLYMVGAMGCASGVGLGAALSCDKPIVVLDGDGAALMKLGTMATIGAYHPSSYLHVVLDNGVHDSTGGQPTVSSSVDFAAIAIACGYAGAARVDSLDGISQAVAAGLETKGPYLIHAKIKPGSISPLGRPTVSPPDVARRFRAFLAGPS